MLVASALRESFVVYVSNGSVLCYPHGTAFVGFVVYRRYSVKRVDVFCRVATL